MEKVKNCPFCGSKVDIKSASFICFHCNGCSADVVFTRLLLKLDSDPTEVEKKSIDLFNRRT